MYGSGFISCRDTDINKFLWMVRIGGSTDKGRHIKEADYFTPQGEFRVDQEGSPILLNCLMYKMCYYRFGQVYTEQGVLCVCVWCCVDVCVCVTQGNQVAMTELGMLKLATRYVCLG